MLGEGNWVLQVFGWVGATIVSLAIAVVVLSMLGSALDGYSRLKSEQRQCLLRATNGFEIKQCGR